MEGADAARRRHGWRPCLERNNLFPCFPASLRYHGHPLEWSQILRATRQTRERSFTMTSATPKRVRCAIYTRVSDDQGLEQDFNSLDAQYDASQSYIRSQAHAG